MQRAVPEYEQYCSAPVTKIASLSSSASVNTSPAISSGQIVNLGEGGMEGVGYWRIGLKLHLIRIQSIGFSQI